MYRWYRDKYWSDTQTSDLPWMDGSLLRLRGNPWWANEQHVLTWWFAHATGRTKKMKKAKGDRGGEEVIGEWHSNIIKKMYILSSLQEHEGKRRSDWSDTVEAESNSFLISPVLYQPQKHILFQVMFSRHTLRVLAKIFSKEDYFTGIFF